MQEQLIFKTFKKQTLFWQKNGFFGAQKWFMGLIRVENGSIDTLTGKFLYSIFFNRLEILSSNFEEKAQKIYF